MSNIVIKAEGIGKSYLIGHESNERYATLRDAIAGKARGVWSKIRSPRSLTRKDMEEFWALKDISFEVKQGERIGIIGRNGAGKSTLLKILSRITEPTTGKVSIKGRVASLLEVGTGFHPELTGRENIYLNGAILGMTRGEIKAKFDEIVDFAEVEKFLDTPVKYFSSGMYVRLAFAVAAHLEPETLVVDEVLAVGDASFQKKCLGKMEDVSAKEGRTVLFVSHNMPAIVTLCQKVIVLNAGAIVFRGGVREGIDYYISKMSACRSRVNYQFALDCELKFKSVEVIDVEGHEQKVFSLAQPIMIQIEYVVPRLLKCTQIVCHIWNIHRVHILATADIDDHPEFLEGRQPGSYIAKIKIPPLLLGPGNYQVSVACGVPNMQLIDDREGPNFEVSSIHSHVAKWSSARLDVIVALPLAWKTESR